MSRQEHSSSRRQPHVVMDLRSRAWKAIKIERLLDLAEPSGPVRLLEVGTGSGGIAHYFANHPSRAFEVETVDVVDSRLVHEGYRFSLVADTALPFPEESFDVVLSNHVIEHVGDEESQLHHLRELKRVLRPGGIGYLAVPNRWMVVEPHYGLAFLSWLPRARRSRYLRYWRGVPEYDCEPLQVPQLERYFRECGFVYRNQDVGAIRLTYEIEMPGTWRARLVRTIPDAAFKPLRRIVPTLIYTFAHAAN